MYVNYESRYYNNTKMSKDEVEILKSKRKAIKIMQEKKNRVQNKYKNKTKNLDN